MTMLQAEGQGLNSILYFQEGAELQGVEHGA